jgi:hypothetical protein
MITMHFVAETTSVGTAQSAFVGAIRTAATAIGLGDLVPATWPARGYIDIPASRLNALLPSGGKLTASDFLRLDLASGRLVDDTSGMCWINMVVSIRLDPAKEATLGNPLTNYWRQVAKSVRTVDGVAQQCHLRTQDGVSVTLLANAPTDARGKFAGSS